MQSLSDPAVASALSKLAIARAVPGRRVVLAADPNAALRAVVGGDVPHHHRSYVERRALRMVVPHHLCALRDPRVPGAHLRVRPLGPAGGRAFALRSPHRLALAVRDALSRCGSLCSGSRCRGGRGDSTPMARGRPRRTVSQGLAGLALLASTLPVLVPLSIPLAVVSRLASRRRTRASLRASGRRDGGRNSGFGPTFLRIGFGSIDLLSAFIVYLAVFQGLPSRYLPIDLAAGLLIALLLAGGVGLFLRRRWAFDVARLGSSITLVLGLASVSTLAVTASLPGRYLRSGGARRGHHHDPRRGARSPLPGGLTRDPAGMARPVPVPSGYQGRSVWRRVPLMQRVRHLFAIGRVVIIWLVGLAIACVAIHRRYFAAPHRGRRSHRQRMETGSLAYRVVVPRWEPPSRVSRQSWPVAPRNWSTKRWSPMARCYRLSKRCLPFRSSRGAMACAPRWGKDGVHHPRRSLGASALRQGDSHPRDQLGARPRCSPGDRASVRAPGGRAHPGFCRGLAPSHPCRAARARAGRPFSRERLDIQP